MTQYEQAMIRYEQAMIRYEQTVKVVYRAILRDHGKYRLVNGQAMYSDPDTAERPSCWPLMDKWVCNE
jgi:hypothetical protein